MSQIKTLKCFKLLKVTGGKTTNNNSNNTGITQISTPSQMKILKVKPNGREPTATSSLRIDLNAEYTPVMRIVHISCPVGRYLVFVH